MLRKLSGCIERNEMNNLIENLKCTNFIEMDMLNPGVRVIYKVENEKAYVLMFVDHEESGLVDEEGYKRIVEECRDLFTHTSYKTCEYLMVVSGADINEVRKYVMNLDGCWMVNKDTRRLIIYENQPSTFYGMERIIDDYLYGSEGHVIEESIDIQSHPLSREELKAVRKSLQPSFLAKNSWMDYSVITYLIVAANVIIFLFTTAGYGKENIGYHLVEVGGLYAPYIQDGGDYIRLFTSMFLHVDFSHLFNNMFCLLIYGYYLEAYMGKLRFLGLYMIGGLGSSVFELIYYVKNDLNNVGVGASGAVYALLGAMVVLALVYEDFRNEFNPMVLIIVIIFSLLDGFFSTENIGNVAHLGGLIVGIVLTFVVENIRKMLKKS